MTPPELPASTGRRGGARRLGLYAPFATLLLAIAAWTVGWVWLRGEVFRGMDAGASALDAAGFTVDWSDRSLSGFPFRLDLDVTGPRLRERSGWGLAATRLKAEAFVFAPDHWVSVAPAGVTLTRRVGGQVEIGAKVLRASLSDMAAHPPRLSVEGLGLTFSAKPGSTPVAIASAEELHLHAKAGPGGQGAAYVELDGARARAPGWLDDVAAGAPVTLVSDAIYDHAEALNGPGAAGALREWAGAGGVATVRRLDLRAGPVEADSTSGTLAIDPDGRLKGALVSRLKAPRALLTAIGARGRIAPEASTAAAAVLDAHARNGVATVTVHFQAGQTTLGPVAIGAAPRVY